MSNSISVLHVDDEPQFLELVSTFLDRAEGSFDVETAGRASTGLDRLTENGFECVVSDYDMPGQNGIEFLNRVRSRDPDLPFILFTGKGSEEVASDAITAGATDYLQKQSGAEQYKLLANRIQNAVEKYRSETAVKRTEQRYHNLVDTAPIPILLFDNDSQLVYANDAAVSFLNETPTRKSNTNRSRSFSTRQTRPLPKNGSNNSWPRRRQPRKSNTACKQWMDRSSKPQ